MIRFIKSRSVFVSLLVSIVVITIVSLHLEWKQIWITFREINWLWLGVAFIIYYVNYLLRTIRFKKLILTQAVPFSGLLGVTGLYGMFNYLLPAKSGEFSYLFLVKYHFGVSLAEGAATLVVARFMDFAAVALFLPVILFVFWNDLPIWVIQCSIIFCLLFYLLAILSKFLLRNFNAFIKRKANEGSYKKIWSRVSSLIAALQHIIQKGQYGKLWILTTAIWLSVYLNLYLITLSLNLDSTFFQMIVVSIILVPLTLLPAQGFANVGAHELAWITAFSLFGKSMEDSINIAVSTHIILLFFVIALGGVGLLHIWISKNTRNLNDKILYKGIPHGNDKTT